jgi:hypothetical protein
LLTPRARQERIRRAKSVIGAWNDLAWDDMLQDLDRIGHERPPTPLIDLDR